VDHAVLRAELLADPAGLGYAAPLAAGNDTAVAALLNARTLRGPVPIAELSAYCARSGITGAVKALLEVPLGTDLAPDVPMTLQLKGLLYTVETLLVTDYRLSTADVDDDAFAAALDGLQAVGVIDAGQRTAVVALGASQRSRADVLFGRAVTATDVGTARNLPNG
jgi:hypothetical protein